MAEGGSTEPSKFSLVTSTDPLRYKLWQARQQGNFSDFQIEVNGIRIPCHKLILAAQSEYFNCMLQHENTVEVTQGSVDLNLLDVDAVKLVVDFMYSGRIEFKFHIVQEVIKVIDRLQLNEDILQRKISEYIMPHLCPDNCLGWLKFGDQMNLDKIKMKAETIMLQRFSDVCKSSEFVSLSFNELTDYVQRVIPSDPNHDQCLKAFVTWALHDVSMRSHMFEEILKIVNLNKCSSRVLKDIYEKQGEVLLNNFNLLKQFTTAALSRSVPEPSESSLDIIVAAGCIEDRVYNRKTLVLNLESGNNAEKTSQTRDECYSAICASPDGLISVGGSPTGFANANTTDCVLYHKNSDTWVDLPSLQTPTVYAGATCVQDTLLMIVGGWATRSAAVCLDLRTRMWTTCRDMLQGMMFPIVSSIDACVYVIFSTCKENETTRNGTEISMQCYDTTTATWTFKSPLPESIQSTSGSRAVTIAGLLYLVGGLRLNCVRYDPTCNSWTILTPPRHSHAYGGILAMNGKIILSGGRRKGGKGDDRIEEYDPSTDTWRLLPVKLPVGLYHHCMILV